jgi:hypothetical protein
MEKSPLPQNAPQNNQEKESGRLNKALKYIKISAALTFASYIGTEITLGVRAEVNYKDHLVGMSLERKESYKSMRERLVQAVGEDAVKRMESHDKDAFILREDKKDTFPEPKIEGFEAAGLQNTSLKQLWTEGSGPYPKKWINGGIEHIKFSNKHRTVISQNGTDMSVFAQYDQIESRTIIFYDRMPTMGGVEVQNIKQNFSAKEIAEWLDMTFSHESGHGNDWDSNMHIDIDERANLLSKIINRVQSPHPGRSAIEAMTENKGYAESLGIVDKSQLLTKASEYWGDMCMNYFQFSEWFQDTYPEDFKIVDEFIKKTDPSFDPLKAEKQRGKILQRIN